MPVGSFTNITNAQLAVGAPVRSVDLLALRDNAIYANAIRGQMFTASGTFTIPTGVEALKVIVVGGGGGSSGQSGLGQSGCGGGTAIKWLTGLTPGANLAVTVGGGGAGGIWNNAGNNNGTTGGSSIVASGSQTISTITGGGGTGGYRDGTNPKARGGVGSGGDLNFYGDPGFLTAEGNPWQGQGGGGSFFGGGAAPAGGTNAQNGNAFGGGGGATGGGFGSNAGSGAAGVVIFEW